MTELEMALIILIGVIFVLVLYIILLRNNIKISKKEMELKKYYIDPCDSPISIKMNCIDRQLERMEKKS